MCLIYFSTYRINTPWNRKAVNEIIKAIGTEPYSEEQIRSK